MKDKEPPVFGDGLQSRDFTYIDNVVSANILAATTPGIKSGVFNVAAGIDNTVLNIVAELNDILGKDIKPKFLDKRPGDVYKTHADLTSIKEKLGYKPLVNFREGLERTVDKW